MGKRWGTKPVRRLNPTTLRFRPNADRQIFQRNFQKKLDFLLCVCYNNGAVWERAVKEIYPTETSPTICRIERAYAKVAELV